MSEAMVDNGMNSNVVTPSKNVEHLILEASTISDDITI
jgi:hypothetical protein